MGRHLPFTLCTPSVPSPGKWLQISLGNHSLSLQHNLVPVVSCSRILKAITQTPKDPEGELCTVSKGDSAAGTSGNCQVTPGPFSCGCLVLSLTVHHEESGVDNFVSGQCSFVSCFSQSSVCAQTKPNLLKLLPFIEMQMSIGLFVVFSHL